MYYWNPKRIKELKAAGHKLHASPASLVKKSDQAISDEASTEATSVRPGPGLKPRYTPTGILLGVDLGDKPQASSVKHQAPEASSDKHQAPSSKRQA